MWETQVRSLGQEDPLEKEMATHSSVLTWRIPWREEPGGLQSMGLQRVGHDQVTNTHICRHNPKWAQSFWATGLLLMELGKDQVPFSHVKKLQIL